MLALDLRGRIRHQRSHRVPPGLPVSGAAPRPSSLAGGGGGGRSRVSGARAPHARTRSTSFCPKDRCTLKAQVSFIFLIKDVQQRF